MRVSDESAVIGSMRWKTLVLSYNIYVVYVTYRRSTSELEAFDGRWDQIGEGTKLGAMEVLYLIRAVFVNYLYRKTYVDDKRENM